MASGRHRGPLRRDDGAWTWTHLELGEGEAAAEAHARAVDEGEQVAVALHLLRLLGDAVVCEPALGAELARVCAPERCGDVDGADGHRHVLPGADGDVVGELAVGESEGLGEWDHVVLRGLDGGVGVS